MPTKRPLSIVSIAFETAPFAKAGGLGDVAHALPIALAKLGHHVVAITPLHQMTDVKKHKIKKWKNDVRVCIDDENTMSVDIWKGELPKGIPVYFIDHYTYFRKYRNVYAKNNAARSYVFAVAAIKVMRLLRLMPDIVQAHDWHAGLVPYMLKKRYREIPLFADTVSVYTIHNLHFQMGANWWQVPQAKKDSGRGKMPLLTDTDLKYVNFAKRAIMYADVVNTVSEQYADEILTKEFGEDLHHLLVKEKDRLYGIVNGIDYNVYNPATDPGIIAPYTVKTLDKMESNKEHLQKMFGLPVNSRVPVIGMVSRITEQKGFDLIIEIMDSLMAFDIQLMILGSGDRCYEKYFKKIGKRNPNKLAAHMEFNVKDATKIYAGSDMFLMPSRFEPCGLGQLISLRYGSVPIVHAVGGLANTVSDFNPRTERGNGFVFKRYHPHDLLIAITRALETYKYTNVWQHLVYRSMEQSYSWEIPAQKYVSMFKATMKRVLENN